MGAGRDGTGAQSSFGFRERVSETGTRKERPLEPLEGRSRPRGAREAADSMEKCLLAPHCRERHRPTACEKFKGLSLQQRQSIIAEQELCGNCLRHSDLDASKRRDCIKRAAEPRWVGSSVRRPGRTPSPEREMPTPVEPEAGKASYACRMDIMARTKWDLRKEEYGASLLFCASRQMTAVVQSVAVEKGLPWRTVPEATVMLGDGRRETSTKLFFIEIKAYRTHQSGKEPNPILIAAYGVRDLAPVAAAAPELPLLRHRFPDTRPVLTMGMLAQKEGPIDLLIGRDYRKQWPVAISSSCFDSDRLYLMKSTFHPGQLLYGLADQDAVGTKMKGVKRRLTLGKGESAGSSTSSSRRPRAATPVAVSPGRRRRESPSPVRRARKRSRGPPSRSTSAASSTEGRQQDRSVCSRRDREDRSVKRKEKESLARETPAKKRRTRVLSSSSSSSSSGSDVVTISSSDDFLHSSSS
jgi:hypothetical protein